MDNNNSNNNNNNNNNNNKNHIFGLISVSIYHKLALNYKHLIDHRPNCVMYKNIKIRINVQYLIANCHISSFISVHVQWEIYRDYLLVFVPLSFVLYSFLKLQELVNYFFSQCRGFVLKPGNHPKYCQFPVYTEHSFLRGNWKQAISSSFLVCIKGSRKTRENYAKLLARR